MVQLDPDADEKNLEDRSKAKYVTPLLCDEESLGSKLRKGKFGRKSENPYKVVRKQKQQQILHIEIKSSTVINEDYLQHPDFVKLCKMLKDELNRLICLNFTDNISVIGILIGGK
ncbi:hypothetical protein CU098_006984, partial [Rhizopus stolonifer]